MNEIVLRLVVAVAGAFAVFTGADFALHGIAPAGADFLTVNDQHAFDVRDSHTRFLGGIWLGVGLVFLAASVWFAALKTALLACIALIFVGGLGRVTAPQTILALVPETAGSLAVELVGMPLLALWVWRTLQRP
jgi:hypothetical protein